MNNKIYIAGRITGDPNYRAKYKSAETSVRTLGFFEQYGMKVSLICERVGFRAINPTRFTFFGRDLEHYPWVVAMAVCLWHLLGCSYVYMLKDWTRSRGARIERKWAMFFGKEIIYQ